MMLFLTSLASALAISSCALASAITDKVALDAKLVQRQASSTNDACGLAASAASSYAAAFPSATDIEIHAHLAYNCLQSIPNRPQPALDLLNAFESYIAFQSDKDSYLLNPPEGYLFPGVDIDSYYKTIRQNVKDGNYDSEYDFQIDLQTMMLEAKDGHFGWNGDATTIFSFKRRTTIASVSADGISMPQVYIIDDLIHPVDDFTKLVPVTDFSPSPIKLINDIDVMSFLFSECLVGNAQDPDSLYNQQFFQLAKEVTTEPSFFQNPHFYPGETTNLTFVNGTIRTYINTAVVNVDLAGIRTGDDAYESFCSLANKNPNAKKMMEKRQASSSNEATTLPFYPTPVISHSTGVVSGYYLNESGLEDVAVLAIYSFEPVNMGGELEFQEVVQAFLAAAVQANKKKLVVDLQGNGGGFIDLGLDTFAQLFPSKPPTVKSNMRASIGMNLLAQTAALIFQGDVGSMNLTDTEIDLADITPFAYQSVMTPDAQNFPSFNSFYGPVVASNGGRFTHFFQNNYTDEHSTDVLGTGIIITGTNNRTRFTQPFAAEDMVLLYDGFCASTCTTFSELMKNFANVQSITMGGRPQTGPAQGVGGIKGAQIFPFNAFPTWVNLFQSGEDRHLKQAQGTIFENFTDLPYQRANPNSPGGVNGRNSFRLGDDSETPLQYVYEASDCRLWWTQEMLYNPYFLWNRVAELAFKNRTGTQFDSPYCVQDSTGHATSISGGWKSGTLGPQTPPDNAKLQDKGWLVNGTTITVDGPAGEKDPVVVGQDGQTITDGGGNSSGQVHIHKSQAVTDACNAWTGDLWMVKLVCGALSL